MRIRSIKPEFWKHEGLANLPDFTRLLALALLSMADDEGYFLASPKVVRGEVFPFEDNSSRVERALVELARCGWIRCGVDDQRRQIGQVVNFGKHQKIDRKTPSKLKSKAVFDEDSTSDREPIPEPSLLEWIRDQGEEQGSGNGVSPPTPDGGENKPTEKQNPPALELPPLVLRQPEAAIDNPAPQKKKRGARPAASELVFPAEWPEEKRGPMREWLKYKEERGERYTHTGWGKMLETLARYSAAELQTLVNDACANNWMGLAASTERLMRGVISTPVPAAEKKGGALEAPAAPEGWQGAWEVLYRTPCPKAWAAVAGDDQVSIRELLTVG